MNRRVLILALVAVGISCGSPATSPSSSTPTTFILNGQVTDFPTGVGVPGASVSVVDGPNGGKSATTDTSGNYSIAALQPAGFTVTASAADHVSASKAVTLTSNQTLPFQLVRSVLNFQGVWAGPWEKQSCSETGSFVGFCALFNGGTMILRLTQSGTTAQGTLDGLGNQMTVSGPIGATGTLSLTGQSSLGAGNPLAPATLTLNNWQSQIAGITMTGSFTVVVLSPANTTQGTATVTATFQVPRVG